MNRLAYFSCLLGAFTFSTGVLAAPVEYSLVPQQSLIYVQVFKDPNTMGAGLSHDHVVKATGWRGSVTWDAEDISACKVSITVPVSGLVIDESSMREQVGYDAMLSDSQRGDVREKMLSSGQLDGDSFSEISFNSTGCTESGTTVNVAGTMKLRGKQAKVVAQMKITADGESFKANGTMKTQGTKFGMEPFSAMFGQLKNQDDLQFTIRVKGSGK
ncbi:MAG: YceI family protein [Myxococcota bacterium]|nr:YceI family protein [Myxococcota bacterium]